MKFSALMSIYKGGNPIEFELALFSTLVRQSVIPNELLLIKDGPLTNELEQVLNIYLREFPDIIRIISLEKNVGLGKALEIGVYESKFPLIARVDADDINIWYRFERQLDYFEKNPSCDVVGGDIVEFTDEALQFRVKKMKKSHEEISKQLKRRNPVNHMTAMYKKESVLSAGNYEEVQYHEDYYLWAKMISEGYEIGNIPDFLVFAKAGSGMLQRRSGKQQIMNKKKLMRKMKEIGVINSYDFIVNILINNIFIYMPNFLKQFVYNKILRSENINIYEIFNN